MENQYLGHTECERVSAQPEKRHVKGLDRTRELFTERQSSNR